MARWAIAGLVALFAGGVSAQTALPTPQELNPAARAPNPAAPRDLFAPPPPGPCAFAGSTLTVTLTEVTFTGLTGVPATALDSAWRGLAGSAIALSELCAIRDRATALLFRAGLLARVEIPEQRIEAGRVRFEVIEAEIVNVRIRGEAGPVAWRLRDIADELRGMRPFNVVRAQRALLLANDLPGLTVRTVVKPSTAGGRGRIDLELTASRDPVDVAFNVQNLNARTTGRWGALARVDFNSLTALGERTSLVFYRTVSDNEQFVVQLQEEARLGGDGLTIRGSVAYGETRPGAALEPLFLRSISTVGNLELAYPLIRARPIDLGTAGGLDIVSQRTRIRNFGALITDDDLRVAYARIDGSLRPWLGPRPALLGAGFTVRHGLDALGATDGESLLKSRAAGRADALVLRGYVRADLPLADVLALSGRVEGQWSPDALLSYEELPLGSLTIGRGYDPASLSGDSGVAASAEARLGPFGLGRLSLAPYAFVDAARVWNEDPGEPGRTLASVGGGAQLRFARNLLLDVLWAEPLDRLAPGLRRPGGRMLVNLTVAVD